MELCIPSLVPVDKPAKAKPIDPCDTGWIQPVPATCHFV